ncbi:MAG: hypothetical protein R6W90_08585 [Ignavibacteriaceae bacterium]
MKRLLIFLCLPLIFISCGEKQPEPISDEQMEVLGYLPKDTQFLMYANLSELRKTAHWKNFLQSTIRPDRTSDWLSEFEKETGMGLSKGIKEVYTSSAWDGNNIIVVTFDSKPGQVKSYFENSKKFYPEELEGKRIYSSFENRESKFYFSDDSALIIVKNDEYLAKLISGKNESLKKNEKFISIIKNITNKNHYWLATDQGSFAATLIKMVMGTRQDFSANKIMTKIDNITLAAEFSDEVQIETILGCKDEKSAFLLSTAIRSAVAMNLFSDSSYILGEIMEKLDVERKSKNLNLEITITEKDILQLQDFAKKRQTDKNL